MAFSGGGSNILKNQTHDSTVIQDGGNLNFQNVTQGNMSAGSITQSDGAHLQELSIGAAGERIQVNAGATGLEYVAAGGGASCGDILNVGNANQNLSLCSWLELAA